MQSESFPHGSLLFGSQSQDCWWSSSKITGQSPNGLFTLIDLKGGGFLILSAEAAITFIFFISCCVVFFDNSLKASAAAATPFLKAISSWELGEFVAPGIFSESPAWNGKQRPWLIQANSLVPKNKTGNSPVSWGSCWMFSGTSTVREVKLFYAIT